MIVSKACYCNINNYIECKYRNNLKVLGEGTEQELFDAFMNIEFEYLEAARPDMPEMEKRKQVYKSAVAIEAIDMAFHGIGVALRLMDTQPGDDVIEVLTMPLPRLKEHGVKMVWHNLEDFKEQFELQKAMHDTRRIRYEELKAELKDVQENKGVVSIYDFYREILFVEKVLGVRVVKNDTNMEEYGVMMFEAVSLIATQSPN